MNLYAAVSQGLVYGIGHTEENARKDAKCALKLEYVNITLDQCKKIAAGEVRWAVLSA